MDNPFVTVTNAAQGRSASFNFMSPLVFPFFLSAEECASVIGLVDGECLFRGAMTLAVPNVRECDMAWLPHSDIKARWVAEKIFKFVSRMNLHTYRFDIDRRDQEFQLTRYQVGDYIDWHPDCGEAGAATRKLAVSIQLSDSAEYVGGDLEFSGGGTDAHVRDQGSIIIFPAFLMHRVTPVTQGTRWSLVTWLHGPQFK
jgi:PKHD-type hydroxylase